MYVCMFVYIVFWLEIFLHKNIKSCKSYRFVQFVDSAYCTTELRKSTLDPLLMTIVDICFMKYNELTHILNIYLTGWHFSAPSI